MFYRGFLQIDHFSQGGGTTYMLVLGRRPGEYVKIGDDITVKVVKSEDGHLRLAIDAPRHIKITRGELFEANQGSK